jgi:hypothetical protein
LNDKSEKSGFSLPVTGGPIPLKSKAKGISGGIE